MTSSSVKYRFLWTWDHSMDWTTLASGIQELGCANLYYKKPEVFVSDYQNLIDFLSLHNFTGVIIYGFLRDSHGGVDSAKRICEYARKKNVLVIPGVGVNCYGGVYWEGKHEFNLNTWLDACPRLEAQGQQFPHHPYLRMACPSKMENLDWMKRAVRWLCQTFDIGGINLETGDYGLCSCDECKSHSNRTTRWSAQDMAELLPPLIEEAEKARPGILPLCECYFDSITDVDAHRALQSLPKNAILQFSINDSYLATFRSEMNREETRQLPPHRKVIRTQIGSQWNNARHKFVAPDFARIVKKVAKLGMDGTMVFGEVSYLKTVHEINYLAIEAFSDNPDLRWDEFVAKNVAPLLGGQRNAKKYLEILGKEEINRSDLRSAKLALQSARKAAYRRWLWMVDLLYQRIDANK